MNVSPKAAEMTKDLAFLRHYECIKEYGGCGQPFREVRNVTNLREVQCPHCLTHGSDQVFIGALGRKVHRIQVVHPEGIPRFAPDLSGQDGRTNQAIDTSGVFSVAKEVSSRSQMREVLKQQREAIYKNSVGEHERMVPFREDPKDPNSPVVWEKETVEHQGFDPGPLHQVEEIHEVANRPKSSFDKGLTLDETERRLKQRVEQVPWSEVEQIPDNWKKSWQ